MAFRSYVLALRQTVQRYLRSTRGNVTLIGTLAAIPVVGAAGMAIDYARISRVHDRMQVVVDGAALAAVSAKNISGTSTQKAATRVYSAATTNGPVNCVKTGKTCRYDGYSSTNKTYSPLTYSGLSTDITLQLGIYDGGIDVKASATVRLAAGTSFIQNGLFPARHASVLNAHNESAGLPALPAAGTGVDTIALK